ncbi:hypothetical protein QAD02_006384, partial [Eretmocerus hayati]
VPGPTLGAEEKRLVLDQFHQGNAEPFVRFMFERFPEVCLIPTEFWTLLLGPREENFKKVIKEKFFQGNLDPLLGFIFNSQSKICIFNGNDIYSLKSGKIEDCIKDASGKGEITLTAEEDQKLLNINSTCTEKAKTSCDRNVCILKEDLKLLSDLYKKSPSINQLIVDRCITM